MQARGTGIETPMLHFAPKLLPMTGWAGNASEIALVAQLVEHGIADPRVAGSIPAAPF